MADYMKVPPQYFFLDVPGKRPQLPPEDVFASSRALMERASKHVGDLKEAEKSIRPEETFFVVVDQDPKTGDDVHKFCGFFAPWAASAILWDAVSDIRNGLDHAFGASLEARGKDGARSHFPFAESAADLEARLSGVPAPIAEVIRKAKPFKSQGGSEGNDALWAIGTLSNAYLRGTASALATAVASLNGFSKLELPNGGELTQPPIWDADKSELEFARAPHGSIIRHKFNLKVEIGFGKVGFLQGKPAVATLSALIEEVSALCASLEEATQPATAAAA